MDFCQLSDQSLGPIERAFYETHRKSLMLNEEEPGELPLMRDVSTPVKKTRGFQTSPASATSLATFPLPESFSAMPSSEVGMSLDCAPLQSGKNPSIENISRRSSRRDGRLSRGSKERKGPQRTLSKNAHDDDDPICQNMAMPASADGAGMDAAAVSTENDCRDLTKNLLRKPAVHGDRHASSRKSMEGASSLLHNWRSPHHIAAQHENSAVIEGLQLESPCETWNRQKSSPLRTDGGHLGYHDEDRRLKSMHGKLKLSHGIRSGQTERTLSPLILNPHDDLHSCSRVQRSFTLEEPYQSEEESDNAEEWESEVVSYQNATPGIKNSRSRFHVPWQEYGGKQPERLLNYAGTMGTFIPSSGGYMNKRHNQNTIAMPWESSMFDFDIEGPERPIKKEIQNLHYRRSMNQKQTTRSQVTAQENESPLLHSRKAARRKNELCSEGQSILLDHLGKDAGPVKRSVAEPLPLLTELEDYNGSDEFGGSSNDGDGKLSISELQGELELESFSGAPDRLNRGRMVKVTHPERMQLAIPDCKDLVICENKPRNLSQKYRPKVFEDMVGQHIVAQALSSAISKGKIAPVYLFQGSRGTGKTSAARIFASALLCLSTEGRRPCGVCRECISVCAGKCSEVREVDAASNNGIEKVRGLLEETISALPLSCYKVFIIDECHVLTAETWNALLKILEEPPMNVVFVLITTDPDRLPRTAVSRCQKFIFQKIKGSEIVKRLQKLAVSENLAIDMETLELIASRSDGSLRDAEITLDQVSLLGQHVNSSTVYQLVGSASDDKMLSLLDSALQADTVTTVRKAKELIDAGVEPLSLMSQLATLITDILAGSFRFTDNQKKGFFRRQSLSEKKLEHLRMAMKTLSEAEKQLRASNDRATWLTAALLQLGPHHNSYIFTASCAGTSVTQSPIALDDAGETEVTDFEHNSSGKSAWIKNDSEVLNSELLHMENKGGPVTTAYWRGGESEGKAHMETVAQTDVMNGSEKLHFQDSLFHESFDTISYEHSHAKLDDVWCAVIEKCSSLSLKQLLCTSVNLVSISISEVDAIIFLEVCDPDHKASCEKSQRSIASLFESVLGFPVEVNISLASLPNMEFRTKQMPGTEGRCVSEMWDYPEAAITVSGGHEWRNRGNMKHQEHDVQNQAENISLMQRVPGNNVRLIYDASTLSPLAPVENFSYKHPNINYIEETKYGTYFESERAVDNLEALSLESQELTALHDKSRFYGIDGRRSCDAHPQKMKTNNLKMVRRLSMRGHVKPTESNDTSSSLMKLPRFSSKYHVATQKEAEGFEQVHDADAQTTQKRGKLKGAAGTFVRLFQGKLTK